MTAREDKMLNQPVVSIYVPCHNYGRFLARALDSVLAQLYANWELFIIDDGSTDDTTAIAKTYANRDPERITFLRNDTPQGLQKTANTVLRAARGQFILRLDGDDWLDEAALLVLVTRALKPDAPAIVFGSYYYVSEEGQIIGLEHQLRLWDEDRSGINPPHGACTLVRTRALRAVGGYSEDINAQDGWELWFKRGGRANTASVSMPVFFYRQHGNSISRSASRLYTARTKIFSRLRERRQGSYQPKILAVIPVRESYPHFAGVPYTELCGRSLLERAVAGAQAVPMITKVIVSADRQAVLDYSAKLEKQGALHPHLRVLRPPDLNGNHIHLLNILGHAGEQFRAQHGVAPDIVLFLNLHAVLRTATSIANAIDTLLVTESDTVVSVVEERDPVFVHSETGLKLVGNGRFDDLFHRSEQILRFNGGIIASWWDVIDQGSLWGGRTGYIEMTRRESHNLTSRDELPNIEKILNARDMKDDLQST
jgi:glycosyltransferase involved in cell wall biosynthesis